MEDWILVVDDDAANLKMASRILGAENMRVSCMKSGEEAVKFLSQNKPDIILLDIHMPGMNGFQTIAAIRGNDDTAKIPVVFLTADEDSETEIRALQAGAMDFIKKPFVPEVLLLRVRHTIDLVRLQGNLASEVEKKSKQVLLQNERLQKISTQLVAALAGAIDAKDKYTNGHSIRVAEYSREIAKRAGLSRETQDAIYMMGLLHDVGKIGVPDNIINKPDKLTDDEFRVMKTHPVLGEGILNNITEFPNLLIGAKYHHERYDGTGYPDGLSGSDIPLEARMIAVADAYDAMTSRRRYRDELLQPNVREEVEKGKGIQFDPVFADIMLEMIDEDADYEMREK